MTGDRFGTAVLCLLITVVAVARLIVPLTPAAGVLFLSGSFRDMALSWGQRVVKVLVMGPFAFLASLVLFAFTSAIFTARMPEGLKYLLIFGLSWVAWRLLRPHTALRRMHRPGKKLLGQVLAMKLLVGSGTSSRTDSNPEQTGRARASSSRANPLLPGGGVTGCVYPHSGRERQTGNRRW